MGSQNGFDNRSQMPTPLLSSSSNCRVVLLDSLVFNFGFGSTAEVNKARSPTALLLFLEKGSLAKTDKTERKKNGYQRIESIYSGGWPCGITYGSNGHLSSLEDLDGTGSEMRRLGARMQKKMRREASKQLALDMPGCRSQALEDDPSVCLKICVFCLIYMFFIYSFIHLFVYLFLCLFSLVGVKRFYLLKICFVSPLVGFKRNSSLLEICLVFPGLNQMEGSQDGKGRTGQMGGNQE